MAHSHDIVGYTFRADLYCPGCTLRVLHGSPTGEPPIAAMSYEMHLDIVARLWGVDRYDETSYDSGEFPKVAFRDMTTSGDRCGRCGEELG